MALSLGRDYARKALDGPSFFKLVERGVAGRLWEVEVLMS